MTAKYEEQPSDLNARAGSDRTPGSNPVGASPPGATALPSVDGRPQAAPAPGGGQDKRPAPRWLRRVMIAGLAVVLVAGAIEGVRYWRYAATHVSTDDAFVTTDVVQITPQVNGNIQQVLVRDNQRVHGGQLLVVLDDSTFRADVDQAMANVVMARAAATGAGSTVQLTADTASAQITQAAGGLSQAESAIAVAADDAQRAQAAVTTSRASEQSSRANALTAQAALEGAIDARRRAVDAVGSAQAQVGTAQAGVDAAQAAVVAAQANAEKSAKDQVRYASLYQENAVSVQQLDVATAAATTSRADLDSSRQQVAQARATVAQKRADLEAAREQVRSADAAIGQARAQLAAAQAAVRAAQATTRQSLAQWRSAQQNIRQTQAKRAQAVGQLNQARTAPTQVAVSRANHETANAKIRQAEAALETARIALRRTRLYAPVAGTIGKKTAEIGQQVATGQPIMAVTPENYLWVVANFKETQMRNVRVGQRAELDVDTFHGHSFTGRVESIAGGTGATFALLPPDNATGNFTKVVQRLPVKVVFDPDQKELDRLRAGLSVTATLHTER